MPFINVNFVFQNVKYFLIILMRIKYVVIYLLWKRVNLVNYRFRIPKHYRKSLPINFVTFVNNSWDIEKTAL